MGKPGGNARRLRVAGAVLGFALAALVGCGEDSPPGETSPASARPAPRVTLGARTWTVRLARTPEELERGLAGVRYLPAEEGMLFIFPDSRRRKFWMKGCRVPLDVAFLDADRRVVSMHTMTLPRRDPPRRYLSRAPARYALEVRAGALDRAGVGVGDVAEFVDVPPN